VEGTKAGGHYGVQGLNRATERRNKGILTRLSKKKKNENSLREGERTIKGANISKNFERDWKTIRKSY